MEFDFKTDDDSFSIDDFLDEKERKKKKKEEYKRRKKYKFSDKKHSKSGIYSSALALFALCLVIGAVIIATVCKGQAPIIVGTMAVLGFFCCIVGFILSVYSFRDTDVKQHFSWLGIISNVIIFIAMAFIVVSGF